MSKTCVVPDWAYRSLKRLKPGEQMKVTAHMHGRACVMDFVSGRRTKPITCYVEFLDSKSDLRGQKNPTANLLITKK